MDISVPLTKRRSSCKLSPLHAGGKNNPVLPILASWVVSAMYDYQLEYEEFNFYGNMPHWFGES
jgi:hypothetical protein